MAISGPTSYVWTTEEFISHWTLVDAQLGVGNELVLKDNITLADLQAKLAAKRQTVQSAITSREQLHDGLNSTIGGAQWLRRLAWSVRADYGDSDWLRSLPELPAEMAGARSIYACCG
ncbi:MAG: hypothetical protein R3C99_08760 [Pirellulaceae bacterium]